jgi:glycosyltransferase involved in cell wall biosynthesis
MEINKIIIINDFAHINGGASHVALSSAIGLAKLGYRITFISAVSPIMEELLDNRVNVITTGQYEILKDSNRLRAAVQGIWNFKAAKVLSNILSKISQSDTIIHMHTWVKALSSSVVRELISKDFKLICTLHDYFIACPNGGFYNYKKNEICNLKPLSPQCLLQNCDARGYSHKLWRICRQYVQRRLGHIPEGISHFIAVSDFSRNILKPYLPPNSNCYTIPNPIDTTPGNPVDVSKNKTFTFIGRLSPEKGCLLVAHAANYLKIDVTFVGAGYYEKDIIKLYPSARITGWLNRLDVDTHLNHTRVLILPSLCYETQGMVVLEAASRGIPAIVPDTCAARDLVDDGVTGLYFKNGDLNDLINKIKLLKNDNLANELGKAAYAKYWANPFTMERHLQELVSVYQKT